MAGDVLSGWPYAAGVAVLEEYLLQLEEKLRGRGPRRSRAAVLAEIRDGLLEAVRRHADASQNDPGGEAPTLAAARAAVAEFGTPAVVVAAYADELAVQHSRRVVLLYLVSGPAVGIWWLLLLAGSPWPPAPMRLVAAIPALPAIAAAAGLGLGVVAATGRLGRWLPRLRGTAVLRTAGLIPGACLLGDTLMLSVLAAQADASSRPGLAVIAGGASVARIAVTIATLVRCSRHQRALVETTG